jgi:hypothetical protein
METRSAGSAPEQAFDVQLGIFYNDADGYP